MQYYLPLPSLACSAFGGLLTEAYETFPLPGPGLETLFKSSLEWAVFLVAAGPGAGAGPPLIVLPRPLARPLPP